MYILDFLCQGGFYCCVVVIGDTVLVIRLEACCIMSSKTLVLVYVLIFIELLD